MGINQPSNGPNMNFQITSGSYHSMNGGIVNPSTSSVSSMPISNISICCLIDNGVKCSRASGNASYSKRIEKQVITRKLRLSVDPRSNHTYICEHHKQVIQYSRSIAKKNKSSKGKDENDNIADDDLSMNDFPNDSSNDFRLNDPMKSYNSSQHDIDFHTLQVNSLRRYKRYYRISTKPGCNKTILAEEVSKHFRTMTFSEKEVINTFMYMIKYNGNKLDQNLGKNAND